MKHDPFADPNDDPAATTPGTGRTEGATSLISDKPRIETARVEVPKPVETVTREIPRYAVGTLVYLELEPERAVAGLADDVVRRYGLVVDATVLDGADEASYVVAWLDTQSGRRYGHSQLSV